MSQLFMGLFSVVLMGVGTVAFITGVKIVLEILK